MLYDNLKEASKYVQYNWKDDMVNDLYIKLTEKFPGKDFPIPYLVVCCKNYIINTKIKDSRLEYDYMPDKRTEETKNQFDELYEHSKHKDLIDLYLKAGNWYKFGKLIGKSDKTAKKYLVELLKEESPLSL